MNNENKPKSTRDKLLFTLCIIGALFVILFAIANLGSITLIFSIITAVLNPVIIGFIIAYLCNPIYNWLWKKPLSRVKNAKLKKTLTIILTYIIVLSVVAIVITVLISQVIVAFKDLFLKMDGYINTAIAWATNYINTSELLNGEFAEIFDFIDVNDLISNLTGFISNSGKIIKSASDLITQYTGSIVIGVKDVFLGILISVYVLIFKRRIGEWFKRLLRVMMNRNQYDNFIRRVDHANGKFGNYIIGALTDSIIVAMESLIIFTICGIPYAPLVAVIVGITNIIPILGPFIGAIPSAFIIFIVDPGKVILFIILIIIIQQIDGNIVAPYILGSSLGLSSFGILIAITVMGGLWGIPGMFIGVPLFAFFADMIEERVNNRLKVIDDPEFPPAVENNDESTRTSPIITFAKKTGSKLLIKIKDMKSVKKNKK